MLPPHYKQNARKPVALLRLWPVEVFFVERFLLVVERGELAFDEEIAHFGRELERIAGGDDDVGDLAGVERADLIGETQDLGGVTGDGFERFLIGQAVSDGIGGLLTKAAGEGIVEAAEGKLDACGGELGGLRE